MVGAYRKESGSFEILKHVGKDPVERFSLGRDLFKYASNGKQQLYIIHTYIYIYYTIYIHKRG